MISHADKMLWIAMNDKFADPQLRERLVATGDAILIYRDPNPHWGNADGSAAKGANTMGMYLMHLRAYFQNAGPKAASV